MIGFDHLGNLGRLGNQMFEYAALRGIAEKHGYDICIPRPSALPSCLSLLPAKTVLAVGVEVLPRYPAAVLPLDDRARIVPAAAILRRSLGKLQ